MDEPLVRVRWDGGSHFEQQWETKAQSLQWMLERYPEIAADRFGASRVYGQLAFAYACQGQRADAARWAGRALRRNWHERRVPFAVAVATGLVSGEAVLQPPARTRARDLTTWRYRKKQSAAAWPI